jgi:hypothetical protein
LFLIMSSSSSSFSLIERLLIIRSETFHVVSVLKTSANTFLQVTLQSEASHIWLSLNESNSSLAERTWGAVIVSDRFSSRAIANPHFSHLAQLLAVRGDGVLEQDPGHALQQGRSRQ